MKYSRLWLSLFAVIVTTVVATSAHAIDFKRQHGTVVGFGYGPVGNTFYFRFKFEPPLGSSADLPAPAPTLLFTFDRRSHILWEELLRQGFRDSSVISLSGNLGEYGPPGGRHYDERASVHGVFVGDWDGTPGNLEEEN